MMTPEELKRIKEAAEKATPGPWKKDKSGEVVSSESLGGRGWLKIIVGDVDVPVFEENATFIALANPQAVLQLIADLEAMTKERDETRKDALKTATCAFKVEKEREHWQARHEKLKEALEYYFNTAGSDYFKPAKRALAEDAKIGEGGRSEINVQDILCPMHLKKGCACG